MLAALSSLVDFVVKTIESLIRFFGLLGNSIASFVSYIAFMPGWLSGLFLSVFMILFVRLIIGR
jgi:hypothetical protein